MSISNLHLNVLNYQKFTFQNTASSEPNFMAKDSTQNSNAEMAKQTANSNFTSSPANNNLDFELHLFASNNKLLGAFWCFDSALEYFNGEFLFFHSTNSVIENCKKQLSEYFVGQRQNFEIELDFKASEFQQKAWNVLLNTKFGQTLSYKEQAQALGDENYARAIGTANSKNPISIIIPCHRIVQNSGELGGYAGGIDKKQFLISLERKHSNHLYNTNKQLELS